MPARGGSFYASEVSSRTHQVFIKTPSTPFREIRESMRECTIEQLNSFGVYGFEGLFMRPDGNTEPDPIYKSRMIRNLLREFHILVHFDDNPNTVSTLLNTGIDAVVIS
jgi:hypothetical protein